MATSYEPLRSSASRNFGNTSSSHQERKEEGSFGSSLYSWISWPIGYVTSLFTGESVSNDGENRKGSSTEALISKGPLFERSARFSDIFEEQFMLLASSAGLGPITSLCIETSPPADYSMHGVWTPPSIEDWATFAAALPDTAYPRYKMVLPKKSKVLALDLDETLVHSTSKSSSDCDYFVEVLVDRSSCLYYVFKRPFVDRFLDQVSNWYHLVIYTASLKEYAEPVVNWLDRGRGLFKKRLFRTVSCYYCPNFLFS